MGAWGPILVTSLLIWPWGPFCQVWSFSSPDRPGLLLPEKKGYRRRENTELWARFTNHGMMHRVRNALEADQSSDEPMVYQELRAYTQDCWDAFGKVIWSSSSRKFVTKLGCINGLHERLWGYDSFNASNTSVWPCFATIATARTWLNWHYPITARGFQDPVSPVSLYSINK